MGDNARPVVFTMFSRSEGVDDCVGVDRYRLDRVAFGGRVRFAGVVGVCDPRTDGVVGWGGVDVREEGDNHADK